MKEWLLIIAVLVMFVAFWKITKAGESLVIKGVGK